MALPAPGEISDAGNLESTQKAYYEAQRDALGAMPGGDAPTTLELSAGAFTVAAPRHTLQPEGYPGTILDNLVTITPGVIEEGGLLVLIAEAATAINILGTGNIVRAARANESTTDPILSQDSWILLQRVGGDFHELAFVRIPWQFSKTYIHDELGLGTLAEMDDGTPDAATLGGNAPAYYLAASAPAADSANLGGVAAANYARLDAGAPPPVFEEAVKVSAGQATIHQTTQVGSSVFKLSVNDDSSPAPGVEIERGRLEVDGSNDWVALVLYSAAGSEVNRIRLTEAGVVESLRNATLPWTEIVSASGARDADLVVGRTPADYIIDRDDGREWHFSFGAVALTDGEVVDAGVLPNGGDIIIAHVRTWRPGFATERFSLDHFVDESNHLWLRYGETVPTSGSFAGTVHVAVSYFLTGDLPKT